MIFFALVVLTTTYAHASGQTVIGSRYGTESILIDEQLSFEKALEKCTELGATLPTLKTLGDVDFVKKYSPFFLQAKVKNENDTCVARWLVDGSQVTNANWKPPSTCNGDNGCVVLSGIQLRPRTCEAGFRDENSPKVVCEKRKTLNELLEQQELIGWSLRDLEMRQKANFEVRGQKLIKGPNGVKYILVKEQLDFEQAVTRCAELNATLPTAKTEAEVDFVTQFSANVLYIGAKVQDSSEHCAAKWLLDDSPVTNADWLAGNSCEADRKCVALWNFKQWESMPCSRDHPQTLCRRKTIIETLKEIELQQEDVQLALKYFEREKGLILDQNSKDLLEKIRIEMMRSQDTFDRNVKKYFGASSASVNKESQVLFALVIFTSVLIQNYFSAGIL